MTNSTVQPARIRVGYHYTVNLGNYESTKIVVEIEDNAREGETVKAAYERVEKFVSDRVTEQVVEAHKQAK